MALKITVAVILVIIAIIALSRESIMNMMTFYPDTFSTLTANEIPEHISEKQLLTADGEELQAFLFKHPDEVRRPLILYFHGNAGNLYHRFEYVQRLYEMNQNILLVSYRGYGKSTGSPNEKGIYKDGEAAVNFALNKLGYQESEIIIFGRSLGTTVAIHVSQHNFFKKVILVTPLTSGKDMATAMGLGIVKFMAGSSFNSLSKINNLKANILIIHGDKDELIPYAMSKKLLDTFTGSKQMITIKNGGHNNLQELDPELFWGGIEDFIK
jgi:uncharacterized protein